MQEGPIEGLRVAHNMMRDAVLFFLPSLEGDIPYTELIYLIPNQSDKNRIGSLKCALCAALDGIGG